MTETPDFPEMTDDEMEAALAEADVAAWRAMEDAADLRAMQRRSPIVTDEEIGDLL